MFDKKITRKEFLVSVFSVLALIGVSKIPDGLKKLDTKNVLNKNNNYGNSSYGGFNKKDN